MSPDRLNLLIFKRIIAYSVVSDVRHFAPVGTHTQPLSIGTPANAKEVLEASQKDLAVAYRWRGIALLAQLVFRDALEVWAGFDDVHFAVVIYEEDQPAHQDRGGVMPPELLLP